VDAATSKNSTIAAVAAIVRGDDGGFLGASTEVFNGATDPETLEVMACREGLAVAADLLLQHLCIASNCIIAVQSISGPGKGVYGYIVQEIKTRKEAFQSVKFTHEGRTANIDAHNLARSSIYLHLGRHVWFQSPPSRVCKHYVDIECIKRW
jgi:ribonuclease HI